MKKIIVTLLIAGLCAGALQAAQTSATPQSNTPATKSTQKVEKNHLLFFLNPSGAPCQMQIAILKEMGTTLSDNATVRYISVTDPSARKLFAQYGIRALPSIIILDAKGNEKKRFPPGIQQKETILEALGGK